MRLLLTHFLILPALVTPVFAEGQANYEREADPHGFTVFMQEGGWCWFQDPRAIIHDGQLLVGSVRGNAGGEALVGVYDLRKQEPLGSVVLHPAFDRDDHNSPVFHARPDGSVLAVYARHNRDRLHYSRISDPRNRLLWGEESRFERNMPNARDRVTYANLHEMRIEGRLYLLFRGVNFDPTLCLSTDGGETWGDPVHFFKSTLQGRQRPYPRYASNGKDTLHVSITDAHPRNFGNSIYYFAYRGGKYRRADGTPIKDLAADGPLTPPEAALVYQGSGAPGRGGQLSAVGAAWTSDIQIDKQGRPHIAYTVYQSNADNRFRIASWDGNAWIDREVAYAGRCLYDREASYTGLITLGPLDPTLAVISTDVDPNTGEDRGGLHEIYRAVIRPGGNAESIEWKPVTSDSPVRNLRPLIVRDGARRVILWNRGDFRTYADYQLDTVGLIESAAD